MSESINKQASITEQETGMRFDQAASQLFGEYSRNLLKQWIIHGELLLNDQTHKPKDKVSLGDTLTLTATLEKQGEWPAQAIPLDIVFEDEHLMVVNKPRGLVVHPGAGNQDQTLLNGLLHHHEMAAKLPRAGIVHRIDKDTTGLLVVAKTIEAHHALVDQLAEKTITRHYIALVHGPIISGGTINEPINRHPKNRVAMAVVRDGKPAVTHYRIKRKFKNFTLLDVSLESGRTHQIRVHMAHIKHPLVADPLYCKRNYFPKACPELVKQAIQQLDRQALHAYRLAFTHPITQKPLEFCAPLPQDIEHLIQIIENNP